MITTIRKDYKMFETQFARIHQGANNVFTSTENHPLNFQQINEGEDFFYFYSQQGAGP